MSLLRRIIYPVYQAPVLTAAQTPETVTESRWHQPWSEPVRFKRALPVSEHPFLAYVRVAPEIITQDKWYRPWSEPVRVPARLGTPNQIQQIFTPPEFVGPDKWWRQLSEPVRFRTLPPAYHPFFAYYPPPIPSPIIPVETNNRAYVTIYEQEYVPSAQVTIYEGKP